jgi:predicted RNase H-like HicB family nuclease
MYLDHLPGGFREAMYRFLIIIEEGEHNYSAYVPDLPGCVATGRTREEVEKNMREAIIIHLEGMIEDQEPIPVSHTNAEYIDISLPNSAA